MIYNYSRHNDFISNFFFLVNGILDLSEEGRHANDYQINADFRTLYDEIEKVYYILKLRFNNNKSYFDDYEKLLLSRYFIGNWKLTIRIEIEKELKKGVEIDKLKEPIIASLLEVKYRSRYNRTWELNSAIEDIQIIRSIFFDSSDKNLKSQNKLEEEKEELNRIDKNAEEIIAANPHVDFEKLLDNCHEYEDDGCYPDPNDYIFYSNIDEDIRWVKELNEDEINLSKSKLKLAPKARKKDLSKVIVKLLKDKYFNKGYNDKYASQIDSLINYIFSPEILDAEFNLSFIKKDKITAFSKVFFYCQHYGFITSSKQDIIKLLSEVFDIGKRRLENITKDVVTKELQKNHGFAYIMEMDLFTGFRKLQ